MNSDTIRQQNHPQVSTTHLLHFRPTANTAVLLYHFGNRTINGALDPFVFDYGTIRSVPEEFEVCCDFHSVFVTDDTRARYRHLEMINVGKQPVGCVIHNAQVETQNLHWRLMVATVRYK